MILPPRHKQKLRHVGPPVPQSPPLPRRLPHPSSPHRPPAAHAPMAPPFEIHRRIRSPADFLNPPTDMIPLSHTSPLPPPQLLTHQETHPLTTFSFFSCPSIVRNQPRLLLVRLFIIVSKLLLPPRISTPMSKVVK